MRSRLLPGLVAVFLASTACAQVVAGDEYASESAFSLRGFGSLGLARSTNGNAELLRDITQPQGIHDHWSARNDSYLGLQAGYRFNDAFEAVVQGASSYRYDGSYRPQLTWGFLKYDVSPRLSVRLGRVGTEFLMFADSSMVGYSYLPVRPPIEFYGLVPINYGDGIDVRVRWPLGDGVLRVDGFAGLAQEDLPVIYDLKGAKILKGSLGYEAGPWQFRYTYAQARMAHNVGALEPVRAILTQYGAVDASNALAMEDKVTRYHSVGANYDDGTWQVQGAVNAIRHESGLLSNSQAAYLLAGRRFGRFSPFVGYSWAKSADRWLQSGLPNPMFAQINGAIDASLAATHIDRTTVSLGTRWDFARNMDLKAQVDFVRSDKASQELLQNITPDWDGKTTVFSLSLDFVF